MVQSPSEGSVVRVAEFVSVRLTPEAYAHGLALALPQEVVVPAMRAKGRPRKMWVLARPTGLERGCHIYPDPDRGSRVRIERFEDERVKPA